MSALEWTAAAALGGAGAIVRFWVDGLVASRARRDFRVGTFAVNLTGAVALGVIVGGGLRGDDAALLGTAAIGSYTTFSTWMLETHRLAEDGELAGALANILLSLACGLGAVSLGRTLGGSP